MKAARIALLTAGLLLGSSTAFLPTAQQSPNSDPPWPTTEGQCYMINGIWYCEG